MQVNWRAYNFPPLLSGFIYLFLFCCIMGFSLFRFFFGMCVQAVCRQGWHGTCYPSASASFVPGLQTWDTMSGLIIVFDISSLHFPSLAHFLPCLSCLLLCSSIKFQNQLTRVNFNHEFLIEISTGITLKRIYLYNIDSFTHKEKGQGIGQTSCHVKHKDLSSDPQHPYENLGVLIYTMIPLLGRQRQQDTQCPLN